LGHGRRLKAEDQETDNLLQKKWGINGIWIVFTFELIEVPEFY
jgi:hypothetical protein